MFEASLLILLLALVLDWYWGEPDFLWSRMPHPVVAFGKAVSLVDRRFNISSDEDQVKYRKGSIAIALLIGLAFAAGLLLNGLLDMLGLVGWVCEILIVFTLLAQKSLYDHVGAVMVGLREEGIEGGRAAVAMIVGRNPDQLDACGVSRAAIESLAENFSDGVVAPAFWYWIFGLPGILIYKMINTADSMIAYRDEKYLWFGRTAAQLDDFANWLPARISALLIAVAAGGLQGAHAFKASLICALRDSGLHRSPNAGWPEAAMAGGIAVALGGRRVYGDETVPQSYLNASGERDIGPEQLETALNVFVLACFSLWAVVAVMIVLF